MKKLLVLSALTLCLAFFGSSFVWAQNSNVTKSKLVGTWVLCNSHNEPLYLQNNMAEFKVITPETFTVLMLSKDNNSIFAEIMGTYSIKDDIYTETITNTCRGMTDVPSTVNIFEIKLKDDLMLIEGKNNIYNQTWKKVKPEDLNIINKKPE